MNYVRTSDGRIFETNGSEYWDNCILHSKLYPEELEKFKKTIIKQADTMDELINRYVIVSKHRNYSYKIYSKCQFGKLSRNYLLNKIKEGNTKVFGAIWTNRGLIYRAIMNEEGQLKLI